MLMKESDKSVKIKDHCNKLKLRQYQIIYDLQINNIEEKRAKTLCYALTVAIQIYRESEFEQRLRELESKLSI